MKPVRVFAASIALLVGAACAGSNGGHPSGGGTGSASRGGSTGTASGSSSGGTGTTSSSSAATTTRSSSSGGSSGGDGGCASAPSGELQPCATDADCGCSLSCVVDPLFAGAVCEYACTQTTDCSNPAAICTDSHCQALGCSNYGGTCDASGTSDGSCIPYGADAGLYGLCQQGGTAPLFGCDYHPTRANPAGLCPPGTFCWTEGFSDPAAPDPDDTVCRPLCNPLTTTTCANGGACVYGIQLDDGVDYGSDSPAFGLCSLAIPVTDGGAFVQAENQVFPQFPNAGGGVIANIQLVTITFQGDPLQSTDEAWGAWAVQSADWLGVVGADYGVGLGSVVANVEIPSAPTALALTDVESYLVQQIQAGVIPAPPAPQSNYVYFIYYPSDVQVVSYQGVGCYDWTGFHDELSAGSYDFAYAVIADCPPFDLGQSEAWNVEATAAHELIETATDPFYENTNGGYYVADPNSSWGYDDLGYEVADLCVVNTTDLTVFDSGFAAQRSWSNSLAAAGTSSPCAPIPPGEVYSNAAIPTSEVLELGAGGSATFPVTAWSNAPLTWPVNVVQTSAAPPALGLAFDLAGQTVTNGTVGTLTLTVPASAPPNSLFTVELESQAATQYAYWPITVWVPDGGVVDGAPVGCTARTDGGGGDPCIASGTICTPPPGATSPDGTCQLPTEFEPCLAAVGCFGNLSCLVAADGGVCLQSCTQNGDCADPTTACLTEAGQQACRPNACGPGTANGTTFYASCNATGTSDGTCLPSGASGPGGASGLCLASGPLATGQSCQYGRGGSPSQLCVAGDVCVASSEGRSLSLCEPLCDAEGGPACAAGAVCTPVLGSVGACAQPCTNGSPACPASTACTLLPPGTDLCSW